MSWLNAINPTAPIPDEAQATRAARAASIALFMGGIFALALAGLTLSRGAEELRAAADAAALGSGLEGQGAALASSLIWGTVAFGLIQLAAGVFQWVRPGLVLPIIVMVLVIWGLVQTALTLAGLASPASGEIIWIKLALLVAQALLCLSAIRGGNILDRFRKARNTPA